MSDVACGKPTILELTREGSGGHNPHDGHSHPKRWRSQSLRVEPFTFYRLRFRSMCDRNALWAAVFFDAQGEAVDADHNVGLEQCPQWRDNTFCFRAHCPAVTAQIEFYDPHGAPLAVEAASVEPVEAGAAREYIDSVYTTIPPLRYAPPPGRWQHLPRTMAALRGGQTLRVAMLGDSIVNDTANSLYDTLIQRSYPGSRLEVAACIRNATGCDYYAKHGRVREYMEAYRPGLLMIGGISNNSTESIRSVITQARDAGNPEVLLMSQAFGQQWRLPLVKFDADHPHPHEYRARLQRLAQEEQVEYLDIYATWRRYVEGSGRPFEWFMRDGTHANERGRQILARILEAYFAPSPGK